MKETDTTTDTQSRKAGDVIAEQVAIYTEIYDSLSEDRNEAIRDRAEELALSDLALDRFIADKAYEGVAAYIAEKKEESKPYPVFGLLKKKAGTTLLHATEDDKLTLCGIDCSEWYGDGDTTLEDVECKRCRSLLKKQGL